MFRTVQPTDLSGLVLFLARALPNEARPADKLGIGQQRVWTVQGLMAHWLPQEARHHTFLRAKGWRISGLVSVRSYPGLAAWEVDQLLLNPEEGETCRLLLAQLSLASALAGIERVFLRLPAESPAVAHAQQAGFHTYLRESLYLLPAPPAPDFLAVPNGLSFRPCRPEDRFQAFRLYTLSVPLGVRTAEGLTMQEWQETLAVRWRCRGRAVEEIAVDKESGNLAAWVYTLRRGRTGFLTLLTNSGRPGSEEATVAQGLAHLKGQPIVTLLLPDYIRSGVGALDPWGFQYGGDYVSLVNRMAVPVPSTALAPA
ncbi:MAG: hypothetical protein HY685_00065 [Chloroflexi bacterium]|nr:hypothetical protein [Chloroflexota bacterium]